MEALQKAKLEIIQPENKCTLSLDFPKGKQVTYVPYILGYIKTPKAHLDENTTYLITGTKSVSREEMPFYKEATYEIEKAFASNDLEIINHLLAELLYNKPYIFDSYPWLYSFTSSRITNTKIKRLKK